MILPPVETAAPLGGAIEGNLCSQHRPLPPPLEEAPRHYVVRSMLWEGLPPQPGGDATAARRGSAAAAAVAERGSDATAVAWNRPRCSPPRKNERLS